jgi:hypothetical protein
MALRQSRRRREAGLEPGRRRRRAGQGRSARQRPSRRRPGRPAPGGGTTAPAVRRGARAWRGPSAGSPRRVSRRGPGTVREEPGGCKCAAPPAAAARSAAGGAVREDVGRRRGQPTVRVSVRSARPWAKSSARCLAGTGRDLRSRRGPRGEVPRGRGAGRKAVGAAPASAWPSALGSGARRSRRRSWPVRTRA